MKVLIACEYSARVRDAIRARGHDAYSCDVRECEGEARYHIKGDVRQYLNDGWDAMIGHPYCTYNTLAGIRWMYHPEDTHLPASERRRHPKYPNRMDDFLEGVAFFNELRNAPIGKIVLENSMPHGLAMEHIGRYTQIVQPWMFGSPFTKAAALWIRGFDPLVPTHNKKYFADLEIPIVAACHLMPPGPNREKERSRTDPAIANAIASQWFGNQPLKTTP